MKLTLAVVLVRRWVDVLGGSYSVTDLNTVNVEIFAQYIFSLISRSVLGARKYDVSEKMNHYSANRINC